MLVLTRKKYQAVIVENDKGDEIGEIQVLDLKSHCALIEVRYRGNTSRKRLPLNPNNATAYDSMVQVMPDVKMVFASLNQCQARLGFQAPKRIRFRRAELPPNHQENRRNKAIAA
jgi:sRNA-binding carbon storage regulator CsrA